MKASIILVIVLVIIGGVWYAVGKSGDTKKAEETPVQANPENIEGIGADISGTYNINPEKSSVKWTGSKKIILDYYDHGTIGIKSGNITINKGVIEGGKVIIDMNSIMATSTGKKTGESNLTTHLKSPDFFDVKKYPESEYTITSVSSQEDGSYVLNGNLKAKDITSPLAIPVNISAENGVLVITGKTDIDRTVWNIKYGSEKFFDKLGDNIINDNFTLAFDITAE